MEDREELEKPSLTRRGFLLTGGAATITTVMLTSVPGMAWAKGLTARVAKYPKKRVASLSALNEGAPIEFKYPSEHPLYSASFIVKLGREAGGGVGADKDIIAFNALCPHMGGLLTGQYRHEHAAAGPCPFHLTTFDLTKHGMVIAGHATESLPQVVLEVEGDDIYATGIQGLIYGTSDSSQG